MNRALALLLLVPLLAGCSGLLFRDPGVLEVTFPPDRAFVDLPLRIDWDYDRDDADAFAVFVDKTPPRPGATIDEAFEPDDRGGIHVTNTSTILLEEIARKGGPERERDRHEISIIALDAEGRRLEEVVATIEVRVVREGVSP